MPASRKILVIEDEPEMRILLQEVLRRAGYEVVTSPYLATAIQEAFTDDFDLITLDLNMPGIDGREIAEAFEQRGLDIPVLVISAALDDTTISQLQENGIQHFLAKPFEISKLLLAVERALSG